MVKFHKVKRTEICFQSHAKSKFCLLCLYRSRKKGLIPAPVGGLFRHITVVIGCYVNICCDKIALSGNRGSKVNFWCTYLPTRFRLRLSFLVEFHTILYKYILILASTVLVLLAEAPTNRSLKVIFLYGMNFIWKQGFWLDLNLSRSYEIVNIFCNYSLCIRVAKMRPGIYDMLFWTIS